MKNVQDFVKQYQGKIVADPKGYYKGECVSLVKQWLAFNGWPQLLGNAIDWQKNGDGKRYVFIKNTATFVPKAGDMAIFTVPQTGIKNGKKYTYDFGHIGIVITATVKTMQVFNQNWPHGNDKDVAVITTFNYVKPKCVGFLRKI